MNSFCWHTNRNARLANSFGQRENPELLNSVLL